MSKDKTIREAIEFVKDKMDMPVDPISITIAKMMLDDIIYSLEQDQGIDDKMIYRPKS